jgi:hypothetical protein
LARKHFRELIDTLELIVQNNRGIAQTDILAKIESLANPVGADLANYIRPVFKKIEDDQFKYDGLVMKLQKKLLEVRICLRPLGFYVD